MNTGKYDIVIQQEATFNLPLVLKNANDTPLNLSGYTGKCEIRLKAEDENPVVSPVVTFDANRKSGKLSLYLSSSATAVLSFKEAYYDLVLIDSSGAVTRVMEGKVILSPAITKVYEPPPEP